MKNMLFFPLVLFTALIITGAGKIFQPKPPVVEAEKQDILACGSSNLDIVAGENGKFIPALPGLGNYTCRIATNSDSTQFYFNQGINFYFSYHFREALASFKEAARFDTSCAMAYWGQALSMGPYFNNYYYKMKKELPEVIELMNARMAAAPEKERHLIAAMQQRYSNDTTNADRPQLDSSYAAAMHRLTKQYPSDDHIKALYIDAVMLIHKWDFWNTDGTARPWTTDLVNMCEKILERSPHHPAALHYYIHLTEASKHPELALQSAEVLKDAMPGVAHMVHMSTHMYQRNGLFSKGVYVNEEANAANNLVDSLAPILGIGRNKSVHIFAVQSYCAMNAGMYARGLPAYTRAREKVVAQTPNMEKEAYAQYVYMMPNIALVRLGRWPEILEAAPVDTRWKYARVLDDFARGLARVRSNNIKAAKQHLAALEQGLEDSLLQVRIMPFNKPVQCGRIARGILKGELLYIEGRPEQAIESFKQAVAEEDQLIYAEPKEWLVPARQYLGACLLKLKQFKHAESVYREDLALNPNNGWSLQGMYLSLKAQGKHNEADLFKALYTKAFMDSDVHPTASVF